MDRGRVMRLVLPSVGDVIFLSIFARTLMLGQDLLNDGDTGWHIAAGRHIIDTMGIPSADIFSHTAAGAHWVAHEWLAEVVFALVDGAAGLNSIVVLTAAVIAATFFMLYRRMLGAGTGPLVAASLTLLAASASASHWLARPHVFSLPLTLLFFCVLDDYARGKPGRLWLLPAVMLVWVNVHAGFFLGLALVFLFALCELPGALGSPAGRAANMRRLKALSATGAATLAATFANPSGPAILLFPFQLTGRRLVMDNVQEWASTNFHTEVHFELLLLLVFVVFVVSVARPRLHEFATLLLLTHMSLVTVRFIPIFAVVAAALSAGRMEEAITNISGRLAGIPAAVAGRVSAMSGRIAVLESTLAGHVLVYASLAASLVVCLGGGTAWGARVMDYGFDSGRFPVNAFEFARENGINGRMFNTDLWGGYITYRGYPEYKVFIDGRYDMYPVELLDDYLRASRGKHGYEDVLDGHCVDWAIIGSGTPLSRLLYTDPGWRLVYADDTADVLVRDLPKYRDVITNHPDVRQAY